MNDMNNYMPIYRIYDYVLQCWRYDMILFDNGELGILNKSWLHSYSVDVETDVERYALHFGIGIADKNGKQIFEGDICTCPNNSKGIVSYSAQIGAYCIFDFDNDVYYALSQESSEFTEIIGNVFDNESLMYSEEQDNMFDVNASKGGETTNNEDS